jgi:hypothetical protein
MMGKFTSQLRELPGAVDVHSPHTIPDATRTPIAPPVDHLHEAQELLEREINRGELAPSEAEPMREILFALREHDLTRVSIIYREAFSELKHPTDALREAYEHLDKHFRT